MKGLYVYGSLLMALSFVTGVIQSNSGVCALALIACALAALSEAIADVFDVVYDPAPGVVTAQRTIALFSWLATAIAAVAAILSLI
jgi:hypothetical protein